MNLLRPPRAPASALCPGSCAVPAAMATLAAKQPHGCFREPRRERRSAKEPKELSANCSIAPSALAKNLYLSGQFRFPATGSGCACACRTKELANNQRLLCRVIHAVAATRGVSAEPVAPGKRRLQTPTGHRASVPQRPDPTYRNPL